MGDALRLEKIAMKMKHEVIESGGGPSHDWANDHVCVKCSSRHAAGRVTVVEDRLKPGFRLACHYHKKTTEIFCVLDDRVTFKFKDESVAAERGCVVLVNVPEEVEVLARKS